jgi:hypothetical protein
MLGANQMAVIPYLENLCGQDETVVRDMAVKSIVNLIPTASDAEITNHIIPMVLLPLNKGYQTCFELSQFHLESLSSKYNVQDLSPRWAK